MTPFDVDTEAKLLFERFTEPSRTALERLLLAAGLHEYLEQTMPALAKVAREEEGHSWADVGEILQITRQAAYQRLGKQPFRYVDGKGGTQVIDPESKTYLDSLRSAYESLKNEPGREDDAQLIADYLRRVDAGHADGAFVPVPMEQEVEVVVEVPTPTRTNTEAAAKPLAKNKGRRAAAAKK